MMGQAYAVEYKLFSACEQGKNPLELVPSNND